MIKQNRGYSLGVLVITIAVMLIITTIAVVSFRDMSGDKEVTNFMNDVQEVEAFVLEYYSTKHVLPIKYQANGNPDMLSDTDYENMKNQVGENDVGKYYYIDLKKLEGIHLSNTNRGYVMNENSLRVYVENPVSYNNVNYYTVTDDLKGYHKSYNENTDYEVIITGSPITWEKSARLLLSVPSLAAEGSSLSSEVSFWTFKYYENGPITAEEFKDKGKLFLYGEIVEIKQNGVVSFYVENAEGYAKVVNVVINKIDDIAPNVQISGDKLLILDHETGVNPDKLMYKIIGQDNIADSNNARPLVTYGVKYKNYYSQYNNLISTKQDLEQTIETLRAQGSGESELLSYQNELTATNQAINVLNSENRDFNDGTRPYPDNESNIAIYVSDMAGNEFNYLYGVSREMLLNSNLIDYELELLSNSIFSVVKAGDYVSGDVIHLRTRSQGATNMLITLDSSVSAADINNYTDYEASNGGYTFDISGENGTDVPIYCYYTAGETNAGGDLIYIELSDTFSVDRIPPTSTAPEVTVSNKLKLTIDVKQTDVGSGIGKVEYGILDASKTDKIESYVWYDTVSKMEQELSEGGIYHIRTRATDIAGNGPVVSQYFEVECPTLKIAGIPNAPMLGTTLHAITWKNNLEEVSIDPSTLKDPDGITRVWYDYVLGDGVTDNGASKWANAKSDDGSYWVWIPRFAYKIIYYTSSSKSTIKGYYQNSAYTNVMGYYESDGKTAASESDIKTLYGDIDIVFLYNTEDDKYFDNESKLVKSLILGGERQYSEYIVHPAFKSYPAGATVNTNGNWQRNIAGFWVAKFEMSRADATYDDPGSTTTIKSVPSVKCLNSLSINQAFNYSNSYNNLLYSHLMKNSEWGAVSYLAYSAYGRNGKEIKPNLASNQITGAGTTSNGTTYVASSASWFENKYGYKTDNAFPTSTTKNVYGVYDMVGGSSEYVTAFVNNGDATLSNNGSNLQTAALYLVQKYNKGLNDTANENFSANMSIYGDGIYELATSSTNIWGNSSISYPKGNTPFFTRGGHYNSGSSSMGIFSTQAVSGINDDLTSFRVVLVTQ